MTMPGRLALAAAACGVLLPAFSGAQAMREDEAVAAFRKLEATCTARLGAEALAPLRARFPLGPREAPSPAMLASPDKPSAAERAAIRALGQARPISLGPRILRGETAAIAGTALWMGLAGDWRQPSSRT